MFKLFASDLSQDTNFVKRGGFKMPLNFKKDDNNDDRNDHVRQREYNCFHTIEKFDRPFSEGGVPSTLNASDESKDCAERPKSHNEYYLKSKKN